MRMLPNVIASSDTVFTSSVDVSSASATTTTCAGAVACARFSNRTEYGIACCTATGPVTPTFWLGSSDVTTLTASTLRHRGASTALQLAGCVLGGVTDWSMKLSACCDCAIAPGRVAAASHCHPIFAHTRVPLSAYTPGVFAA